MLILHIIFIKVTFWLISVNILEKITYSKFGKKLIINTNIIQKLKERIQYY